MLLDPDAVQRVEVGYWATSWQDTDGSPRTLTGVGQMAAQATSSGTNGHAARAGLARIDEALGTLQQREPDAAHRVAARIAAEVNPNVLETHLPAAHALLRSP